MPLKLQNSLHELPLRDIEFLVICFIMTLFKQCDKVDCKSFNVKIVNSQGILPGTFYLMIHAPSRVNK